MASAKNRSEDEAELHFPLDSDIGTPVSDIPIIIVYNGHNHYAPTKPLKPTFKDGVKELVHLLCAARVLCDKLGENAEDPIVKQVFSKASENSQTAMYSVDKLIQNVHQAPQEEAAAPSKRRRTNSGDEKIKRHARDGTTKWTSTMCKCGVEKHTKEDTLKGGMLMVFTLAHVATCRPNSKHLLKSMFPTNILKSSTTGVNTALLTKQIKKL